MYVFTFSWTPQWAYYFAQVIAHDEKEARALLGDHEKQYYLESTIYLYEESQQDTPARVVFSRDYDNPSYEG